MALERGDDSVRIGAHRKVGGAGPQDRGDLSTADFVRNNDYGALTRGLDDRAQQLIGVGQPWVVVEHNGAPVPVDQLQRQTRNRVDPVHRRAGQCENVSCQRIGAGGSGRD